MLNTTERAWLRLHLTRGIGRAGLFHMKNRFGTPEAALQADRKSWLNSFGPHRAEPPRPVSENDPVFHEALDALETCQARIVTYWDEDYPEILKTIHDPPALLYVRGSLDPACAFGIVGSRRASEQGKMTTREISTELARCGMTVVSGMARGIDSAAHEGALSASGLTIAVLGCGIDRIYPKENRHLYHKIPEQGAIISEYPPGTEPLAGHFPGRNRIISGLSRGVLIVEAAEGSGSLITADFALEQGREVFAIPGALRAANSKGVNRLLKDGAHLVTDARDILDVINPGAIKLAGQNGDKTLDSLDEQEKTVVEQLYEKPVQVDDLARKSGLTPTELSAILLQLELRGVISQLPGMRYIAAFRLP